MDNPFGYGPTRWRGGNFFFSGTGSDDYCRCRTFCRRNLIIMVWTSKQVSTVQVVRNWRIVHTGNIGGAVATAFVVFQSVVFQDNQLVIEKI